MKSNSTLPQWLVIIGQSGSGKGTAASILANWYKNASLSVLQISTGDLIRNGIDTKTYLSQKMKLINDVGLRQPAIIAASFWLEFLLKNFKQDQYILHEGSPRSTEEFAMMHSLVEIGYISSMKIVEIQLPDKECHQRLANRTKQDKRIDLSLDNHPGVPDLDKIYTKLFWWSSNRKDIVDAAKEAGMYINIQNTGSVEDLEKSLAMQFGFTGMLQL
jgi:adenylate kinase family enzyme